MTNHARLFSKKSGITLIEILIVVTLIAVLMAAIGFYFQGVMPKARDGQRKADLRKIATALESFRSDWGGYPVGMYMNLSGGNMQGSGCGTGTVLEPYLPEVPCDPEGGPYYYDNPVVNPTFPSQRDPNIRVKREYRILTHLVNTADPLINETCSSDPADGPTHCGGRVWQPGNTSSSIFVGNNPDRINLNFGLAGGTTVDK